MSIGFQSSPASINNKAGNLAARWQQLANDTLAFSNAIAALGSGGLTGLTPAGFAPADATAMLAAAVQLNTIAQVYYGTLAQAPAFNFDAAFLQLRGTGGA